MAQRTLRYAVGFICAASLGLTACGESRKEKLERLQSYENAGRDKGNPADAIEKVPPDPMRDEMAPLLDELYTGERLPDVLDADVEVADETYPYQLTAGALSQIRLKQGLSPKERAKAIIVATAEADAWVHRTNARRNYAEHVQKLKRSFDDETRDQVMRMYAELRLLEFFNGKGGELVAKLSGAQKAAAEEIKAQYAGKAEEVWSKWMDVKMMARREVASDEPFKAVLRRIKKELGQEEPDPIAFLEAHDPQFEAWAKTIDDNEELLELLTNLKELADREEFRNDTHAVWVMEGSSKFDNKAKGVEIDDDLGFGVKRQDLGLGYNDFTFVFPKRLSGAALKRAYLRSHIYRHMHQDYQMLATAGSDFEGDIVPDKYDPEYARCGSLAAVDTLIDDHGDIALLSDLKTEYADGDKRLVAAHECIIERCSPDIKKPAKDDEMDVEGPAPASRLAFFQMLARFEKMDVNAMRKEREKSDAVKDAEALLQANPNEQQ